MTKHDWFAPDGDDDTLLRWLGHEIVRQRPAAIEDDERFTTWLARDLRRRPPAAHDWGSERVHRVRRRVLDRALMEQLGLAAGSAEPPVREVPPRSMRAAVEEASRSHCAPWTTLAAAAGVGRDLWDEECDRWIELPGEIEAGRFVALQVAGDSMVPLLHSGDTILVKVSDAIARDTVVVARHGDDGYVVKRVGRVSRRQLELLSLNEAYAPVIVRREPGTLLGTVMMRWCPHGQPSADSTIAATRSIHAGS